MRELDYLCVAWYADCDIDTGVLQAIGDIFTSISGIATVAAVLIARRAWLTAKELDAQVAKRAFDREVRDSAALAHALRPELILARTVLGVLDDANIRADAKCMILSGERRKFELPILSRMLSNLGCFDASVGESLGHAFAATSRVFNVVPTDQKNVAILKPNLIQNLLLTADVAKKTITKAIAELDRHLAERGSEPEFTMQY